jgi:hypothetical protein
MVILTDDLIEGETFSQILRRVMHECKMHPDKFMRQIVARELDLEADEIGIVITSRSGSEDPLGTYVGTAILRSELERYELHGSVLVGKAKEEGQDFRHCVASFVNKRDQSDRALWLYSVYAIHLASEAGLLIGRIEGIGILLTDTHSKTFVW